MSDALDFLLPARDDDRIYGVVLGVVTNNQDPDKLGRVKLRFPWLSEDGESEWAPIAALMGGSQMGTYFLPEVDDQVLVAFGHGDVNRPFVLGAIWNDKAKPPEEVDAKNNVRTIKSRSGHVVRLDDTDGSEKIQIVDKTEKNSIVFDTAANTITILADTDVKITATSGKLVMQAKGGVEITTDGDFKVDAKKAVEVKSGTNATLKAGSNLEASGGANAEFKAGANGTLKAGADLTIKGVMVNIN